MLAADHSSPWRALGAADPRSNRLAGSAAQVKDKLHALREEVGLSYFVVFDRSLAPMTEVVAALAGT